MGGKTWRRVVAVVVAAGLVVAGAWVWPRTPSEEPGRSSSSEHGVLVLVGSGECRSCHQAEWEAWSVSHHGRAMREARARALPEGLDGASFHDGSLALVVSSTDEGLVLALEEEGAQRELAAPYLFGAHPLVQFLVPREGGRFQAFPIAWDTRPAEEGGRRLFRLPFTVGTEDEPPMHWTSTALNWNHMCGACHSTGFSKGYDAESDTYASRSIELAVGCESCHGAGSGHVEWMREGRRQVGSGFPGGTLALPPLSTRPGGTAHPASGRNASQIDRCAPCHSRRALLVERADPASPFLDGHAPALISEGLYHVDGQILDEVFVYGSFLQSRMAAAGVGCTDCHEPHTATLRAEGNALCHRCHASEAYGTPAHHHHEAGAPGSACVDCHMPGRNYMGHDFRRDHSFRRPRPDLSARLQTPNACSGCHTDRSSEDLAREIERWLGRPPHPSPGEAFFLARRGDPRGLTQLSVLARDRQAPPMLRATALLDLGREHARDAARVFAEAASDPDDLVRFGAASGASHLPVDTRMEVLPALLDDPRRVVRIEAARGLALAWTELGPSLRRRVRPALEELEAAEMISADRPEAQLSMGAIHSQTGDHVAAERAYLQALSLAPTFVPAMLNLAELYRSRGRGADARALIDEALAASPRSPDAHYVVGLARIRDQDVEGALEALRRATDLAPESSHYAYVLGIALAESGRLEEALDVLRGALERRPYDESLLTAFVRFAASERPAEAEEAARRLQEKRPTDAASRELLTRLGLGSSGIGVPPSSSP